MCGREVPIQERALQVQLSWKGWMNVVFSPKDGLIIAKSFDDASSTGASVQANISFSGLFQEGYFACLGSYYSNSTSLKTHFQGIFHSFHFSETEVPLNSFMASPTQCPYLAHSFGINTPELILNGTKYENYELLRTNQLSYIEDLNTTNSIMTTKRLVFGYEGVTLSLSFNGTIAATYPLFKFNNTLVTGQCVGSNLWVTLETAYFEIPSICNVDLNTTLLISLGWTGTASNGIFGCYYFSDTVQGCHMDLNSSSAIFSVG